MVDLARYRLRGILIIVGLIVLLLQAGLGYTIFTTQQNITSIEENQANNLERDQLILEKLTEAQNLINEVVQNELQNSLESLLNYEAEDIVEDIPFLILEDISELLKSREINNYRTTRGLEQGPLDIGVLFRDIPNFDNLIDKSSTGASGSFSEGKQQFSSILFGFQETVQNKITDLENTTSIFNNELDTYNSNFDTVQVEEGKFVDAASNSTNSTYIQASLQNVIHIGNNLSDISQVISNLEQKTITDPLTISTTSYRNDVNTSSNNIASTFSEMNNTIEADDYPVFDNYRAIVTNTTLQAIEIIDSLDQLITSFDGIRGIHTNTIDQIRSNTNSTITNVRNIIQNENEEYSFQTSQFIESLRTSLNTWSLRIFGTISFLVLLAFSYIIFTISNNLGRIISKNEQFAKGDLLIETRENYPNNEVGVIESSLDSSIQELREVLTSVKDTSETLAGISEELAAASEEASASINQVSSTVREFSAGSSEQNIMLTRVRENLLDHLDVVERTANQIEETANFVLQVAKRTNILGLNASIEAAKAGRFGLGFNVVAEEVRELSEETKESADRIAKSIEEIEQNMQQTVEDTLDEVEIIREVAENTASGSEEASAATSEQVTMMNEISETSAELSDLSQNLNTLLHRFEI